MRVSVEVDDPGYVDDYAAYEVYFNGHLCADVRTADEERSLIVMLKRGLDGNYVVDGERIATVKRRGTVKIIRKGSQA